jgi:hypothetical protein
MVGFSPKIRCDGPGGDAQRPWLHFHRGLLTCDAHNRMSPDLHKWSGALRVALLVVTFAFTLLVRIRGIGRHFWLLGDQIRDWTIALRPFTELPLVGPATHVGGYTIGPAFYWILWAIRVVFGPWYENMPHAGGVGQATLQSAADVLLLAAVWHRTRSVWLAMTTVVVLATAAYDLCLSALVWNPVVGSTLAKAATALVLLDWHRKSATRVTVTAALAWIAVHAYTGAIFVAVSVFAALLVDPFVRGDRRAAARNAGIIAAAVAVLQLPYLAYQVSHRFGDRAMGAVTGSLYRIVTGSALPEIGKSVSGYASAFTFIEGAPWPVAFLAWALLASGAIVAIRYRRDPTVLAIALLPQVAAVIGYALFLDDLDHYYYLSLMPASVLTMLLAATAMPSPRLARAVAIALFVGALAVVPARVRFAATMHRLPEYGVLVEASRKIASMGQPMRQIVTEFALPETSDPEYLYRILGGRIDRASPWIGVITPTGDVIYRKVES